MGPSAAPYLGLTPQATCCRPFGPFPDRRQGLSKYPLRVSGSLGLLGRAKAEGLISELKPLIAKAIDAGIWYNRELVRSVKEWSFRSWRSSSSSSPLVCSSRDKISWDSTTSAIVS